MAERVARAAARRGTAAAVALALALSGCALMPSMRTQAGTTAAPAGVSTTATVELPTKPGPLEHGRGYASVAAAVRAFIGAYINWDAADVRRRLSALAKASVGQARSALELQAAQTGSDPELRQAGVVNSGTVEAVAPLRGAAGRWVAVTRESTSATRSDAYAGLGAAWHIALLNVVRRDGRWVVSGFEPES